MVTKWVSLLLVFLPTLAWADCTPAQLQTALTSATLGIDFATPIAAGNDALVLSQANQPGRAGAPFTINRGTIGTIEAARLFDPTEFAALTLTQHAQLQTLAIWGNYQIDLTSANVRTILAAIFPAGPTRTAFQAYVNKQGSWSEVTCGRLLTLRDISCALRGACS